MRKRINNLEQNSRIGDIIITGLKIQPRSYAKAVTNDRNVGEGAKAKDLQTLEMPVAQFLSGKDIHLDLNNILACHTLPRKKHG